MSHAPSSILSRRHQVVRQQLDERGLDALVVTSLPNVLYLTNFPGSSAIAILTRDRVSFITDFRYLTAVNDMRGSGHECPDLDLVLVDSTYEAALVHVLLHLRGGVGRVTGPGRQRIGFESAHMTVARHAWLEGALGGAVALVPCEGIVEHARVCKDEHEQQLLREAARLISTVANGVMAGVRRGQTERDVALVIDSEMRRAGFDRAAFETIVASGPNSALPHARPTQRILGEGDLVVLDFGGVYASYCVDLTRTISIGRASERAREVYGAVREAHDRAVAAVRPGQLRFAIDDAARQSLAERGMAEAFGHGTGHGLGIEVHEEPRITRRRPGDTAADATDAVRIGMVFTIEPGAYFAGFGGVRIEDDVLVTAAGADVLTDATTELVEI